MSEEADIIQHLLEIEAESTAVLLDAQKKADEEITRVKARCQKDFSDRYAVIVAELEKQESDARKSIKAEHDETVETYKASLESLDIDQVAFDRFIESYIAG